MAGCALISCEIGTGTSYINLHGQTGLVVPPANSDALAEAMNALLNDELLATAFGSAARKRYEQFFTAEQMGKSYAALYRQML